MGSIYPLVIKHRRLKMELYICWKCNRNILVMWYMSIIVICFPQRPQIYNAKKADFNKHLCKTANHVFLNKNMNLSEFKSNNGNFMIKGRQIEPTKIPHINTIEVGDSCNVNSVDMCTFTYSSQKRDRKVISHYLSRMLFLYLWGY